MVQTVPFRRLGRYGGTALGRGERTDLGSVGFGSLVLFKSCCSCILYKLCDFAPYPPTPHPPNFNETLQWLTPLPNLMQTHSSGDSVAITIVSLSPPPVLESRSTPVPLRRRDSVLAINKSNKRTTNYYAHSRTVKRAPLVEGL